MSIQLTVGESEESVSWHYAIMQTMHDGRIRYGLHSIYDGETSYSAESHIGYTIGSITCFGETPRLYNVDGDFKECRKEVK